MGITIIEKSTPRTRRLSPKLALVLAGGAVTGGAFKLGGLAALDDYLTGRKVTDFDLYVGLSAGALLAAPLASGLTPKELLGTLEGIGDAPELGWLDFYSPNLEELFWRPIEFLADLTTWFPNAAGEVWNNSPATLREVRRPLDAFWEEPNLQNGRAVAQVLLRGLQIERPFPFFLDYAPSGIFDNWRLERFLHDSFEARGLANNFRELFRSRGKELYVVAVNLDTAERVVFGHDEDAALTISQAVQATTALPGFYKPARIKGVDYIDGGVRRTANIDVAIEHGADLIIAYNPFRPFNNEVRPDHEGRRTHGAPLADHGLIAVANQVFRSMLHSRLHLGLNQYREDPNFRGDIILIEPSDTDESFFNMFPLNFLERKQAADHGYLSVSSSIDAHHEALERIFERYGLPVNARPMDEGAERIRQGLRPDELMLDAGNL